MSTALTVTKYRVFSGQYFPVFVFGFTGKYGPEKTQQGYDQTRELFCTNSFVLVHSSAKNFLHCTTTDIMDQKKLRTSTLFTQWSLQVTCEQSFHVILLDICCPLLRATNKLYSVYLHI